MNILDLGLKKKLKGLIKKEILEVGIHQKKLEKN